MPIYDIILIVIVLALLLKDTLRDIANRSTALDAATADRLEQIQRDHAERLERLYRESSALHRMMVDRLADALRAVAPLTPLETDDAASALLDDIRE